MNGGMSMGPPAHGDPLGLAVVVVGVLATLWTIVFAVRVSVWPGETDPQHPKRMILKDDR